MNIGMLWFDNDPKDTPAEKIRKAAVYYEKKYGQKVNACMVHPTMGAPETVDEIKVKVSTSILINHLFLGVEQ